MAIDSLHDLIAASRNGDSLPDLSAASRNGLRATSLWAAPGQPQRCIDHEDQMTGPSATDVVVSSASFTMFSASLSVSLYAIHTRTSPSDSIHRHVLQPFALPRRVIAITSRRAVHVCRNRDLIDRIELSLCASFISLCQSCCVDLSLLTWCIHHHPRHECYKYHNHHLC